MPSEDGCVKGRHSWRRRRTRRQTTSCWQLWRRASVQRRRAWPPRCRRPQRAKRRRRRGPIPPKPAPLFWAGSPAWVLVRARHRREKTRQPACWAWARRRRASCTPPVCAHAGPHEAYDSMCALKSSKGLHWAVGPHLPPKRSPPAPIPPKSPPPANPCDGRRMATVQRHERKQVHRRRQANLAACGGRPLGLNANWHGCESRGRAN